jgi:hypothetical protein
MRTGISSLSPQTAAPRSGLIMGPVRRLVQSGLRMGPRWYSYSASRSRRFCTNPLIPAGNPTLYMLNQPTLEKLQAMKLHGIAVPSRKKRVAMASPFCISVIPSCSTISRWQMWMEASPGIVGMRTKAVFVTGSAFVSRTNVMCNQLTGRPLQRKQKRKLTLFDRAPTKLSFEPRSY